MPPHYTCRWLEKARCLVMFEHLDTAVPETGLPCFCYSKLKKVMTKRVILVLMFLDSQHLVQCLALDRLSLDPKD